MPKQDWAMDKELTIRLHWPLTKTQAANLICATCRRGFNCRIRVELVGKIDMSPLAVSIIKCGMYIDKGVDDDKEQERS